MIDLSDLTKPLTTDQVFEQLLDLIETLGVPARSWVQGRAMRVILRAVATMIALMSVLISDAVRATFLDTATGAWLDALAYYVYAVRRVPATFATGQVRFDNTGGGLYTKAVGEVRVYNPATKKSYTNSAAFTVSPLQAGVVVPVIATEAGSQSSSAPGTVSAIETTMLGVTVTNPLSVIGTDAERDQSLRQACRDKLATLSPNGPRDAYSYFTKRATRLDGTLVDVNRVTVTRDSSYGRVVVYCASPSGAPAALDVTACYNSCRNNCVPDSVSLELYGAVNLTVPVNAQIWARRELGGTIDEIKAAATAALIELQRDYPIGGVRKVAAGALYADFVSAAIVKSHPAIFDVDGIGPDISLSENQVVVFAPTFTVNIVASGT